VTLHVSVLGIVEVGSDHRWRELRGRQQRALLSSLALAENRPVSAEALITELWGEEPPQQAANALQAHISRLRRVLAKVDGQGGGDRLRSASSGYLLRLCDEDVFDARSFARTVSALRHHAAMSPGEINRQLRAALEMWRGPVFGGTLGGPICQAAAARLEATRAAALELYFDNELRLGNHAGILAELSEMAGADPLNERICELLMVALYRAGRQTNALATYHQMRRRLDEDLGVDPSPELRMFQQAILDHDPMLGVHGDHSLIRMAVSR
jgi:SARP family transcriptional regulator, regulator of embCAB operon